MSHTLNNTAWRWWWWWRRLRLGGEVRQTDRRRKAEIKKKREFGILDRSIAEGLLLEPIYHREHANTCHHLCTFGDFTCDTLSEYCPWHSLTVLVTLIYVVFASMQSSMLQEFQHSSVNLLFVIWFFCLIWKWAT